MAPRTGNLAGKRVAITRASEQAGETAARLRERGAVPIELPTIEIGPPDDPSVLANAVARLRLGDYDVVALTSANAVRALFTAMRAAGLDPRTVSLPTIATVGPGTAKALATEGVVASIVASEHRGEGLAEALLGAAPVPKRVLLPRAAVARDVLPDALRAAGVVVDVVDAYRTQKVAPDVLRARIVATPFDVVTFTASSTVDAFCDAVEGTDSMKGLVIASIGPITSDTLRARGLRVDVEASPHTIPALLDALEAHFEAR